MHNTDRILNEEMGHEYGFLNEGETYEYGASHEFAHENEWQQEWANESAHENEWQQEWTNEWEGEAGYGHELSQEQLEYELASELLSITNEAELEQFLGRLVRGVARGVSNFARSGIGRTLIGGLKSVAKVGLPILGKVAGTAFGGPLGGMIGGKLGSLASNLFEVQMEGMSNEDREFEIARRVVRFSTAATQNTLSNLRKTPGAPPSTLVNTALKQAAAQHAPGLLTPVSSGGFSGMSGAASGAASGAQNAASGTWTRQGSQIIVNL